MELAQSVYDSIMAQGLSGVVLGVAIFAIIYVLDRLGLLSESLYKRLGVLVSAVLFSGYEPGDVDAGIQAVIAILSSTFVYAFKEAFKDFLGKRAS